MNETQIRQLDEQGFVLLERCMPEDVLRDLRCRLRELFDEEGDRAGTEFRTEAHAHRLANLVDKGDDFTRSNGATRIVPGSHTWQQRPQEVLADPMAPLRRDVQERLDAPARHMLALDDPLNDQVSAGAVERSGFMKEGPRAQ